MPGANSNFRQSSSILSCCALLPGKCDPFETHLSTGDANVRSVFPKTESVEFVLRYCGEAATVRVPQRRRQKVFGASESAG